MRSYKLTPLVGEVKRGRRSRLEESIHVTWTHKYTLDDVGKHQDMKSSECREGETIKHAIMRCKTHENGKNESEKQNGDGIKLNQDNIASYYYE